MSRRPLTRRLVVLALSATVLLGAPAPAAAAGSDRGRVLDAAASGPLTGTSTFEFEDGDCGVRQVFEGTFAPELGRGTGTIRVEGCTAIYGEHPFPFVGTFVLTTTGGAQLSGTVTGTVGFGPDDPASGPGIPVAFTLEVTDGTRWFRRASGTVTMTARWESSQTPGVAGPLTGDLDASLSRRGGSK